MDQETFNLSIRKFLKMVGVSSQREIEQAVSKAIASGAITGSGKLSALAREGEAGRNRVQLYTHWLAVPMAVIQGYSQRTGLTVTLRDSGQLDDLPQAMQQSLLRIVQESLANVHRHASASRVTVKLQRRGGRIHLLIADNGTGLRDKPSVGQVEEAVMPLGVGIPGMAARARQLGGRLDVRSRSSGTLVHASLPIGPHANGAASTTPSERASDPP